MTGTVKHAIYFRFQDNKWYLSSSSEGFEFIKNIFGFKFDKDEIYEIKKMDVFLNMIGEQYQREEKLREAFNKARDIIVGKIVKR